MKFPSWLEALKAGPSRRPIRRGEPCGPRRKSATGNLSVENLEERTVPAFLAPTDYPTGSYPISVVSGRFNNDAIPDLAVANYYASTVSVRLGNADGTFQNAVQFGTGSNPTSLAVGDFDGDGFDDLVTKNGSNLSVLLGNGDGTFQAASAINDVSSPMAVAVGDFNDDGTMDLGVTSNFFVIDGYYQGYYGGWYPYGHYEGRANVLLGNGDGSFDAPLTTDLGYAGSTGTAVADFNGDGKDDLVTVDGSSTVRVLLANPDGSGNLLAPANYTGLPSHYSVAVGDVNGDGIDDLVTRNSTSVSALLGNGVAGVGDGTFQAARITPVDFSPQSLAVGDFNDDGTMDLGAASNLYVIDGYRYGYYGGWYPYGHYEGQANVLLGYGNGHFTAPESTALGAGWMTGLASGDFDGDGFTDLAATNSGTNILSVLINDQTWAPLPPPSVSISDAPSVTEGNTGSANATFTVSIPFAHTADLTIQYATGDSSAAAGSDYTDTSGDVTIRAGDTTATFTVPVLGDRLAELTETFVVNLTSGDAPIADGQGLGTILDDEPTISIGDAPGVLEGHTSSTNATFTVTLAEAYDQDVTVHYATGNDSAAAGSDYTDTSGDVTIRAGDTTATFTVPVLGDRVAELDETFVVNLSGATNAHVADGQGLGTILDDEPRVNVDDVSVVEGNAGTKTLTFTITLTSASPLPVVVSYTTSNGSANTSDYRVLSGTVTFAPGQTSKTVNVLVKGDRSPENDEEFYLNLTTATGAIIDDGSGRGTILDNEPRISIDHAFLTEGHSGTKVMTFTVTLSAAYDQLVTVRYATQDFTATKQDYKATSGTLRFSPGETSKTITVTIKGDTVVEDDEFFLIHLSRPSNNALLWEEYGGGIILNDD